MANKISVILDVATDKAVSGLKGFKASINDADGAVGKFKAGAGSAFESVKAHAGQLALAGGAALVGFGVKAVAAFQDTALAAGKLADASGLAVEDASKWIAVGDDIGVSAETIQKSFGKLNKELGEGNTTLEKYGITVQKNKDGQVDANATVLAAIDRIKAIQDPTKKATAASEAFGRGWQEMGELINMGSAEIAAGMDAVSDAQIIDDKELAKARKFREALDNLQDKFKDIATEVGEKLVPVLSDIGPMLETIGDGIVIVADAAGKFTGALSDVNEAAYDLGAGLGRVIHGTDETVENLHDAEIAAREMFDGLASGVTTLDGFIAALDRANVADTERALLINEFIAQHPKESAAYKEKAAVVDLYTEKQEGLRGALDETVVAEGDATKSAVDYKDALQELQDAMDRRIAATETLVGGDIAVRDAQREAKTAVEELTVATDTGALSQEELAEQTDGAALKLIDAAKEAAAYDEKIAGAAGKTLTASEKQDLLRSKLGEVASTLAPGSPLRVMLEEYIALLDGIPPVIETNVRVTRTGDLLTPINGRRASGGPVAAGGTYVVGEQGPELLTMGNGSGHITPNGAIVGGATASTVVNVTVNAGMGADGREIGDIIVGKIREYERRNGSGWRG